MIGWNDIKRDYDLICVDMKWTDPILTHALNQMNDWNSRYRQKKTSKKYRPNKYQKNTTLVCTKNGSERFSGENFTPPHFGSERFGLWNGSERFRTVQNGSERFRTVLNYLHVLELSTVQRTVQNGFLAHVLGLRCRSCFLQYRKVKLKAWS